jgi:DNA-binding response OmpR family regulator
MGSVNGVDRNAKEQTMRRRILIVEDDWEMIELGDLFLRQAGYEVLTALGGKAGLEILRTESVDLVLLDIMMAGMDGWDVLKAMRAHKLWQDIPVIVLSARHYLEDEKETAAYAEMFTDYVVKPFAIRDLLEKIEAALALGPPALSQGRRGK